MDNLEEDFKNLKDEICGLKLNRIFKETDNTYELFSYNDETSHQKVRIYLHSETDEYRIEIGFGLNKFCLTELFTDNLDTFKAVLYNNLEKIIKSVSDFSGSQNFFLREKGLINWQYGCNLPPVLEGFELFISPNNILEITNGSFVIIDYCDFNINSDLVIYYNIFRDDFGGEVRINGTPTVIYDFDANNLNELEGKLQLNLNKRLSDIRLSIENSINKHDI